MTGRRRFRGWIMLWAVLQLALPATAAFADAALERGSAGSLGHVESSTGKACIPAHSDECAICHIVLRGTGAEGQTCLPAIAIQLPAPPAALAVAAFGGEFGRLFRSRAPPTA